MRAQPISCSNLGPKQKRKRVIFSVIVFALAAAVSFWMVYQPHPYFLRFFVFPPFFIAILGFLQAKERTCVFLGLEGMQDLDQGKEPVRDSERVRKLVQKSQNMLLVTLALASGLTLLFLFV